MNMKIHNKYDKVKGELTHLRHLQAEITIEMVHHSNKVSRSMIVDQVALHFFKVCNL